MMSSNHLLRATLLIAVAATAIRAEELAVDWSAFSGGGGTATAGVYTITGIISQPSAARVNSRDFTIDGGFWSIVAAIQEPGAPKLSVRFTQAKTVVVSWPMTWPGFALWENSEAYTTNWVEVAKEPVVVVTSRTTAEKQVVVPMPAGKRFYRLRKL